MDERDDIDIFSQLAHMSTVATAGMSRSEIFDHACKLPYISSPFLKDIHVMAQKLGYDYGEACRLRAMSMEDGELKELLLRLSSSLTSGEPETEFLDREAKAIAENYTNTYEKKIEGMKRWTDAYVALIISATLVVIISVVSVMIYQVSTSFIAMLSGIMVAITSTGAWIIFRTSPKEIRSHSLEYQCGEQKQTDMLFKICIPAALVVFAFMVMLKIDAGWTMVATSMALFPVGAASYRLDRNICRLDNDLAAFLRSLGGVSKAIGTTVTEALNRLNPRATGSLMPLVNKLKIRLRSGIKPDLCWWRLVGESGSALFYRSVHIFWDAIVYGGEPEITGSRSAYFAMKIALLRHKRQTISSSFTWLVFPMQGVVSLLLVFIVEIMSSFGSMITAMKTEGITPEGVGNIDANGVFTVHAGDMSLLKWLAIGIILVMALANSIAARSADGGHKYKFFFYLSVNLAISGACLAFVPHLTAMIFSMSPTM